MVRFGNNFFVARGDTLELGYIDLGRPNPQYVDAGAATFTLATAGLPAWNDFDTMFLFSHGANLFGFATGSPISGPTAGQVPSSFTWDYGTLGGEDRAQRIDASKGDSLWALYLQSEALVTTPVPGAADDGGTLDVDFSCNVSKAAAQLTSLTINSGPNAAPATFATTPVQSVGIIYPRTQWAARASEVHSQATVGAESLYVFAGPSPGLANAELINCFNFPAFGGNPISDINRSLMVVDRLPTAWRRMGMAQTSYRVIKTVLDAGTWTSTGNAYAEAGLNQPLGPQVHSPIQVRVQGIAADQLVTVAAAMPLTVTWQPSAGLPAATGFSISLLRMTRTNGSTSRPVVARAFSGGNSFSFPAEFITPGAVYQLRVQARVSTASESAPYNGEISSQADAITNPFIAQ